MSSNHNCFLTDHSLNHKVAVRQHRSKQHEENYEVEATSILEVFRNIFKHCRDFFF